MGEKGAVGFYFLTDQQDTLTADQWNATWNNLQTPMIATAASNFATWKALIEQFCSNENDCVWMTDDQKTEMVKMNSFFDRASSFSGGK